ncbi:MAG TPA: hypothetical protein VN493_00370 [Thermoanaerobaculia bacterium]|nr:hypothetical protein [Thermoanaerobaculia bacterium]
MGFQVKSDNDLASEDFTLRLKAQIHDAQAYGLELFVVVFACSPTKQNYDKIKGWMASARTHPAPEILCLPPERAAGLFELFDQPIEPIALSGRTWPDFFRIIGKPHLDSFYLDTWPGLMPDERFLPPEVFSSIRQSVRENRLTFLVGSPAAGKTFTSIQLLWEGFRDYRTVHWLTATGVEPTEGPIPRAAIGMAERVELKRRVDELLRAVKNQLGRPPVDALDIVSRFLEPDALVYIEDPFGKSEDEYGVSLSSYDFFDLQRLVEELERNAKRADCRILVTSREPLFQRWLSDLRAQGREAPGCSVIRLNDGDYYPGPLYRHAVLLAGARGLAEPEAIAEVLVEHVESPFEIDMLIRSLPLQAGAADAESAVAGWSGDLREKIGGRITPRDDRDVLVLLLIAASDLQHESLRSPSEIHTKLHSALGLEGDPEASFEESLKRLSPFLASEGDIGDESLPFVPSHSIIAEAIREQLAAARHRPLLRQIALILPDIPPIQIPSRSEEGFFDLVQLIDPWGDHLLVAFYLLSLGLAFEGEEEAEAFDKLIFDQARAKRWSYRKMMAHWHLLPARLHNRIFEGLERAPQEDAYGLRDAVASLPHSQVDPPSAWRMLELLLKEPRRGGGKTPYEEAPWDYLFLHLEEVPQGLKENLDAWAREDPASFVHAMDEGLLLHWDRLPDLWRSCLSHPDCTARLEYVERLVWSTARHWDRASQPYRELFDSLSKRPEERIRALVGSKSLFHAERHPDLEGYALAACRDPDPWVRLETFRWGRGDEAHRRVAEALLDEATPGVAAEMMLDLLEEEVREEIVLWEKEVLARCEQIGGDAARAAIALATFDGKTRVQELGYRLAESPFEEPEIVRAAWLWTHLNNHRAKPPLSDDDLKALLQGLRNPRIRAWCLFYTSRQLKFLPDSFEPFLEELSASSPGAARAIQEGARQRPTRDQAPTRPFLIRRLVD